MVQSVSVLIPPAQIQTVCAGAGGMDPGTVAGAIIRGVKTATSAAPLSRLTNIRLVLIKIDVFLAFKEEATQVFSTAVLRRGDGSFHSFLCLFFSNTRMKLGIFTDWFFFKPFPLSGSLPQFPYIQQQQQPLRTNADVSILDTSPTNQQSVFLFLGLSRNAVDTAKTKLKDLYQAQCSTQTFTKEQLEGFTQDDINDLKQLVETEGLFIQWDLSGQGSLTVSGLKDGVSKVMQMINTFMQGSLLSEVRVREEENLYTSVAWCILAHGGNWERLPRAANYKLENDDIAAGIEDALDISWTVNLQKTQATSRQTGQMTQLKRLHNQPGQRSP